MLSFDVFVLCLTLMKFSLEPCFALNGKRAQDVEMSEKALFSRSEPKNVSGILNTLFTNYDKRIRPYSAEKPVKIGVSLGIHSISHFMEENMEFIADIFIRQMWHDRRLAFSNNTEAIVLREDDIPVWLPDTYIDNSRKLLIQDGTRTVLILGNGTVLYTYRLTTTAKTNMNFQDYPADVQSLHFKVLSYGFDYEQVEYHWIGVSLLLPRGEEFRVSVKTLGVSRETYLLGTFSLLTVDLEFNRKAGYFVMQIYLPCILCTVISWLPFWMNRFEIGDRLSLGITTLLTEVFLLEYTNGAMPKVSYIKAADLFLIISFTFIFMALLESVVVYNTRLDITNERKRKSFQKKHQRSIGAAGVLLENESIPLEDKLITTQECSADETKNDTGGRKYFRASTRKLSPVDVSLVIDKICRVVFPLGYSIFLAYYFIRYPHD